MANVPLRAYIREIESLIDRGNTDEAIAHCRHILMTFPKHLDTYRMLGKANLESKRYAEAADVFKRILLAVPDDFVSHVGMSIIADDQKHLDETIWHMERAFEVQPSNAAVQSELQRLYGQRDGREPHKIRLTRGALAHMYVQGELYAQAISEIRSVIAEDPSRTDMLVLLALAYYRSGQKADASDACSQLLNKFPYCLAANQILVELLPGTGMADTIPTYRNRVFELDPYAAHAPASIFQSDEASENAVMIARLEYTGQPVSTQMDWRGSLASEAETPAAPLSSSMADTPASGEAIPEWMREHGWGESSGTFDEASFAGSDSASEGIERADLPDWIRSMAPSAPETLAVEPVASEKDSMDFLSSLGIAAAGQSESSDTPSNDWLSGAGDTSSQEPAPASGLPDWLSDLSGETAPEQPVPAPAASGLGDLGTSSADQDAAMLWLESLAAKQGANADELITDPNARTEQAPEWVEQARSIGETPAAPPASAAPSTGLGDLGTSSAEQDAAMSWLESLAAKQGANADELITDPNARTEQAPEWVEQARVIGETQESTPAPDSTESIWPVADDTGIFERPSQPAMDETSVWLRKLESDEEQPPMEQPASMSAADAASSWLENLDKEESAQPAEEALQQSWMSATEEPAVPAQETTLPTWLQNLEQEEASASASATSGASALDDMPSWLKEESREQQPPEPTHPTEWVPETKSATPAPKPQKPITTTPPPAPKPVAEPVAKAPAPKPAPKPKEPRKAEPSVERVKSSRGGILPPMVDAGLDQARDYLAHAKIPDALQAYGALIRKGKMLEDIIFDLKEALYRFPVEVSIWQALGDAYMRANRLQDALDAYTKAEELLR